MTTVVIKNMIFRPSSIPKKFTMRDRRYGHHENYSFRSRGPGFFERYKYPLNQRVLGRIMGRLHYLSSHAPEAVNAQWRNADRLFHRQHYGVGKQSVRYANTWTMHSWT